MHTDKADKILKHEAIGRLQASDASIWRKLATLGVTGAVQLKTKLEMTVKRLRGHRLRIDKGISFKRAVASARNGLIAKRHTNLKTASQLALSGIRKRNREKFKPPKQKLF